MRSELQIQASRLNGAKSRGPTSPQGRRAAAGNHIDHGLLAESVAIEGEDCARLIALAKSFHDMFDPQDPVELHHVETMILCRWRQMRLWGLESDNVSYAMRQERRLHEGESPSTRASLAFRTLSDDSRSLDIYNRYERSYDRQFIRAHARLLDLRFRAKMNFPLEPNQPLENNQILP